MSTQDSSLSRELIESWFAEALPLPDNMASLVAISALSSSNHTADVASIARRRIGQLTQPPDQAYFVQQTRESIMKMTAIIGMPRTINALTSLMSIVDSGSELSSELSKLPSPRSSTAYNYDQIRNRGKQLFASVYDRHADVVEGKLRALYPDLAEVIIADAFGRLLSETRYLNGCETELCAIGSLVPQNVPAQLKSHCIGAKRLGASEEMIQAALRLAKAVFTRRLAP
ncbi:hypothetical protein H4R99_007840 [Coemansia sp. RSA 1722]|nr:hypothetical protein LPJ57_006646 [Coemansia sp. RSA 486]KAJ2219641.1 hypothetical protein IWW45_009289 [Coemansia sp. RSA 485]KAJ2588300.1 hypothetical protein H4R99_007840 [Coemansia sp. RSA 1722]